jgi:hypothetical protein
VDESSLSPLKKRRILIQTSSPHFTLHDNKANNKQSQTRYSSLQYDLISNLPKNESNEQNSTILSLLSLPNIPIQHPQISLSNNNNNNNDNNNKINPSNRKNIESHKQSTINSTTNCDWKEIQAATSLLSFDQNISHSLGRERAKSKSKREPKTLRSLQRLSLPSKRKLTLQKHSIAKQSNTFAHPTTAITTTTTTTTTNTPNFHSTSKQQQ